MGLVFLVVTTFIGLLVLAYLEDPRTEEKRNINRLVKESIRKDRLKEKKARRCYRYMCSSWPNR